MTLSKVLQAGEGVKQAPEGAMEARREARQSFIVSFPVRGVLSHSMGFYWGITAIMGKGKLHTLPPLRLSVFITVDKEPIQKQNYGLHCRDSVDEF